MTKFPNKKSLGQNFLTNENIARKIAESANLKDTNILEIGAGEGFLTKHLADLDANILSIEIDENLKDILDNKFQKNKNVTLIFNDILKIDLPRLIEENDFEKYKVVANLPYYITSKIIRLFLETKYPPAEMILMVQKEVGERIVARGGKESILSISVKFYAEPEILFGVPREDFEPSPEVDSVVIRIKRKKNIPDVEVADFFKLVRAGFSAKRKMLTNNLSNLGYPRAKLLEILEKAGLDPTVRAEKLRVENWVKLYQIFTAGQKTR